MSEEKEPHGNSKKSKKEQHLYVILNKELPEGDNVVKYGISGQKLNKDDSSPRANAQIKVLNLLSNIVKYFAKILKKGIKGRKKALKIEQDHVDKYAEKHDGNLPTGSKRPKVSKKNKK